MLPVPIISPKMASTCQSNIMDSEGARSDMGSLSAKTPNNAPCSAKLRVNAEISSCAYCNRSVGVLLFELPAIRMRCPFTFTGLYFLNNQLFRLSQWRYRSSLPKFGDMLLNQHNQLIAAISSGSAWESNPPRPTLRRPPPILKIGEFTGIQPPPLRKIPQSGPASRQSRSAAGAIFDAATARCQSSPGYTLVDCHPIRRDLLLRLLKADSTAAHLIVEIVLDPVFFVRAWQGFSRFGPEIGNIVRST